MFSVFHIRSSRDTPLAIGIAFITNSFKFLDNLVKRQSILSTENFSHFFQTVTVKML